MEHDAFVRLMETIAESWNTGDTERALACFTDDAVYMEPPDEQRYEGRDELYEFFGGAAPPPMHLAWHHLVVDGYVGVAEYTYRGEPPVPRPGHRAAPRRRDLAVARVPGPVRPAVGPVRRAEPLQADLAGPRP